LDELPPLDGRLRLVVYGGLFALALTMWKSPLRAALLYAQTDPILYRAEGLMAALRLPWLPPWVLQVVVVVTAAAWICAAIGFLARTSAVVTAVGAFTIHGYCWASSAYNHNWYLAVYVLIALSFAASDPGWLDGHTIAYWSEEDASKRNLARWLGGRMWLSSIAAWFTLFFEAGAPLALISRRLRPLFVLGWIAMHVGIRLTMGPRYFENILLFALLFDWTAVRAHGAKGFVMRPEPAARAESGCRPRTLGERAAPALGSWSWPACSRSRRFRSPGGRSATCRCTRRTTAGRAGFGRGSRARRIETPSRRSGSPAGSATRRYRSTPRSICPAWSI
jgi:hypothetical protein